MNGRVQRLPKVKLDKTTQRYLLGTLLVVLVIPLAWFMKLLSLEGTGAWVLLFMVGVSGFSLQLSALYQNYGRRQNLNLRFQFVLDQIRARAKLSNK